jgi:hypothetical protein
VAIEEIVTQHEAGGIAADELPPNEEASGEPLRGGLLAITERESPVGSVAQSRRKAGKSWGVPMIRISRIPDSISVEIG